MSVTAASAEEIGASDLLADRLCQFEARVADDEVKVDLELTCQQCGEVVCDVEQEDTLDVLVRTVLAHVCGEGADA